MSVKCYPVNPYEICCEDYRIKINGQEVTADTARVSAYPINRRWPGHQRQMEQTELINFVSLAADEALFVEVLPKRAFEKVTVRPLGSTAQPQVNEDGWICFTIDKPGYYTLEPYGRHCALHLFIDPVKEYEIDKHAENVICYGPGVHEAGTIHLQSGQTLYLEEGALVYGSIRAYGADNIKILGKGILDNSHNKEVILFEANVENNSAAIENNIREHTVQLEYCDGIEIDGITIRDSLVYAVRPIACKNLRINGVKIIGSWRYNSDGIDMHNCENVHISDCFIRTYDDSICVKGFDCWQDEADMYKFGKSYDVFKNVLVENCTIWNDWGKCLEIGAECRAKEISNILWKDCKLIHVTGSVLDCMNVDYADIHDVTYENITVEYDDELYAPVLQKNDAQVYTNPDPDYVPFLLMMEIVFHHEYSGGGLIRGKMRNFLFKDIALIGRQSPAFLFAGYDAEHLCKDITIENLTWNGQKVTGLPEDKFVIGSYCENVKLC